MKYFIVFFVSLFFSNIFLRAQTLEDAQKLYTEKNYAAAADIYFQLYLFGEAANAYEMQIDLYTKAKKPKLQEAEDLKPKLLLAQKTARMLSRCEDVQIIDSIILNKDDFLNAYLLSGEAGNLEQEKTSVVYENQLKTRRYFADKKNGDFFRLYSQAKIQDDWMDEKLLNIPTDSLADDNYPFVLSDGLTIYYASTGNGSIGGYDLFISRYNLNTDTYLAPNQLGMPFNSIYNDYMLAVDEMNNVGYFATDRFQPEDKVIIYTFIPNEEFQVIETDNKNDLVNRSKIASIRDSWATGADYRTYLSQIRNNIEKEKQDTKKDFTFVINDHIVYHALGDFDSDSAKKSFLKSKDLQEKIQNLEKQLDAQRQEFANGNSAKKQSLRSLILSNEKRLEDLSREYGKSQVDTRNLEIKYLRTKN